MEILIAVVIAIVVIGIISVFFLMRTGRKPIYSKPSDEVVETDDGPAVRAREARRPRPASYPSANGNLTSGIIIGFRVVLGIAVVALVAYFYSSTQAALNGITDNAQITRIYTAGIFKVVITIGIGLGLYILSRFTR